VNASLRPADRLVFGIDRQNPPKLQTSARRHLYAIVELFINSMAWKTKDVLETHELAAAVRTTRPCNGLWLAGTPGSPVTQHSGLLNDLGDRLLLAVRHDMNS
jgi:hypothetical protein